MNNKSETLNLPPEVVDSGWKDDIFFEPFKNESEYKSPVDGQKINKKDVKNIDINKIKNRKIGHIALFKRNDEILV